jgi:tRNA threonylcarbamoyladenosine biosynthesis protein TsaE
VRRPAKGAIDLPDAAATTRLGAALARALRPGEAVCLSGPLGAGKSVLARGAILELSPGEREAPSPTFTLVQSYPNPRLPLSHLDLYRLASAEEAYELGLEDALREGAVVIEWAERLGGDLPADRIEVVIAHAVDAGSRRAMLTGHGAWKGRDIEL